MSRPDRRLVTSSKGSILEVPVCRALRGQVVGTVAPSYACPKQLPDIGFNPKHPCHARGLRQSRDTHRPRGPESSLSCVFGFASWEGAVCRGQIL